MPTDPSITETGSGHEPTLFVVATPLGNLADLSARAERVLAQVDIIFAEDTRRTRKLLEHLGVRAPIQSLHAHNEKERSQAVLHRLAAGCHVAYVTDAGTPGVSDPGSRLVALVAEAGYGVAPIPGPSALAAALSVAGFSQPHTDVLFLGFLPAKGKARRSALERVAEARGIVVIFAAPHRLVRLLEELTTHGQGQRDAVICRELTKVHEELLRGSVAALLEQARAGLRGELVLVLGPLPESESADGDVAAIDAALGRCLQAGLSQRDAISAVAAVLQQPKRQVYRRCLARFASSSDT